MLTKNRIRMHRTKLPKNKEAFLSIVDSINEHQLLAYRCKESLFTFVKQFWAEAGIHEEPIWNWHIEELCKEIEKIFYRVAANEDNKFDLDVNIPPGTTKSLLFTVFAPAWAWTKWPWFKFIKLSYSAPLSLQHAEICREIVRSDKYQILFPEIRVKRDKDQKSNFSLQYYDRKRDLWKIGGALFSTSIKGTVTGMHGHVILIDDPIDPFKSFSAVEIESVNKWIQHVLPTRKINKAVTPTIMIMQRTHPNDPSGHNIELKKKGLRLKRIVLPGYLSDERKRKLVKPKRFLQFYDNNNGFLDPIRLNKRVLEELELKLGQYGFKAQVDQDPASPGGMLFNTEDFTNYFDSITYNHEADFIRSIRYWDKAGTADGGKYTAGVKMAELRPVGGNPRYLIMDVVRGRWASEKRESMIELISLQDGSDNVQWIEQEPGSGGKESAENTIKRLKQRGIACMAERPVGDKFFRADPFSVAWNRGQVWMVRGPWNKPFLDELANFSPSSEFKDQVDAAGAAYSKLNRTRGGTW